MLHEDVSADRARRVRLREIEISPITPLIFVEGEEADLVHILIGIELENFLVVVIFAMNEGDK